jgi:hypothetical protein
MQRHKTISKLVPKFLNLNHSKKLRFGNEINTMGCDILQQFEQAGTKVFNYNNYKILVL